MQVARTRPWWSGSPHGSRTGYLPWLISCGLLRLNPRVWREHLTSQLPQTISHMPISLVCIVVDDFSPCVLWSMMIGLMLILLKFFLHGVYGITYGELLLFWRMSIEFKDRIMLHCFREVKCKQGITAGIW